MEKNITPLRQIIEKWRGRKDFLIEILQDIQDEYNHLSPDILTDLSTHLNIPLNQIYEVATYYKTFSLEPKGRFRINICQGTACHVRGAVSILDAFKRELKIKIGETDKSRDFTLDVVRCIGCCGLAPVLTINEDVYAKFDPSQVPRIVETYRKNTRKRSQENSSQAEGK